MSSLVGAAFYALFWKLTRVPMLREALRQEPIGGEEKLTTTRLTAIGCLRILRTGCLLPKFQNSQIVARNFSKKIPKPPENLLIATLLFCLIEFVLFRAVPQLPNSQILFV
ncbi:hypothetical protein WR25_26909 [Diploscapter pachys]|uniref:Uncharacterized protein n=1 Tax=Diploscapter pachys TaxID=2018661 RepID=A0A2A2JIJ4_9BILA|nr:hypothetical protein WR25_26909 [Diploscapter pachys]